MSTPFLVRANSSPACRKGIPRQVKSMPAASRFWARATGSAAELRPLVPHHQQLIPQSKVVVGRNIADDLPRRVGRQRIRPAPGRHCAAHIPEGAGLALDIPRLPGVEAAPLMASRVLSRNCQFRPEHRQVVFDRLVAAQAAGPALPRLAVHQYCWPPGRLSRAARTALMVSTSYRPIRSKRKPSMWYSCAQ